MLRIFHANTVASVDALNIFLFATFCSHSTALVNLCILFNSSCKYNKMYQYLFNSAWKKVISVQLHIRTVSTVNQGICIVQIFCFLHCGVQNEAFEPPKHTMTIPQNDVVFDPIHLIQFCPLVLVDFPG